MKRSIAYELMSYATRTLCVPYNPENKFQDYVTSGHIDQASARFLDEIRNEVLRTDGIEELYNAGNVVYAEDHDCLEDMYNEYYKAVEEDFWFQEPEDIYA